MRVVMWSELYWPYVGGAELFLAALVQSIRQLGHECLVVTSHHDRPLPDEDVHEGVPVHRLPFRAAIQSGDIRRLTDGIQRAAAVVRGFDPDLVHMNAVGPSALFQLRVADRCAVPLVVTLQQEVLDTQARDRHTLLARVLDAATWVVGCSHAVLGQVRAVRPDIAPRSSCILNGIAPPETRPSLLPDPAVVLCLGRLVPAKGFDVALRAFARLAPSRPALRLWVAGDGAARPELEGLAGSLGIADRVAFLGWVEPGEVPALINRASFLVMPSRREGLPLVAVQAAFMARPVVGTTAGGLGEVLRHEETGLVVPAEDPGALARSMARLIDDRELTARLGAGARAHACSHLDWDQTVAAYDSLYRTLGRGTATHVES
jgi:glycogen(starch) synthase